MKSVHRLLIPLLCLLALLCLLVACGGRDTPSTDTAASGTVPESAAPESAATETPTESPETSGADTAPPTVEVETYPIYEEVIGPVRVQLYSPSVLRVEEAIEGAFCDEKTVAVTNRTDWEGVRVERTEQDGTVRLVTEHYTVEIPVGVTAASEVRLLSPAGERIWDPEVSYRAAINLPAPGETPTAWAFNDRPRATVPDGGFTTVIDQPDNGFTYQSTAWDYYIFVCNGDPLQLRADYNHLLGACDLVTVKTLGLWFSRYYAYSESELVKLVQTYRRKGYPLDYLVVDTDWKVGGSIGYDINTQYFPNMKRFFTRMHDMNVNVAFNDHVREYPGSMLDPEQIEWFNGNLTDMRKLGLDTWWYDRNWSHRLITPFAGLDADMMGQILYRDISRSYDAPLNRRTVVLSNYYRDYASDLKLPAYVGTHRYSVQWTGDIHTEELESELRNLVEIGALTSTAYISSDIGGYANDPGEGLFIRWTQYGALSPIMRYHSQHADRSPWLYGKTADRVAQTYISMRYRLMPLFYTLAYENYADGLPMARRLDLYYPQYKEAQANDQYLLGEDILVAPITESDSGLLFPASAFTTPDGKPGIRVSFYNNTSMTGEPAVTTTAETVNFDWQHYAPADGVNADQFSMVLEAKLTVPERDVYLSVKSDDGVRVYIDGTCIIENWKASDSEEHSNTDVVLEVGKTYDLRIEYYDDTGLARLSLCGVRGGNSYTRSVFIPDGEWMDVFSGEVYTGPQTITVSHGLKTSPLFVRKGSSLALAYNAEYADTDQWERLVLDVYPAEGTTDTSTLYEDDGASLDYQSGGSRETTLSTKTEGGRTTVTVSAAAGNYTTAWTAREWTVRVHATDVESVTVNGQAVDFTVIPQDTTAAPFATEGGAPDGDIVTFTFTAPLGAAQTIVIE